jgi:hypothetical protein
MSSVVDFHLRTSQSVAESEQTFRAFLREKGVDPTAYWIHFRAADADARERGRRDFGLEPTVVASVQPPRNQGDGELDAAILATVHSTGAELVAFHDGTPLFSYRDGVVHLTPDDRAFYEEHVLPGFTGQVNWDKLLPWLE